MKLENMPGLIAEHGLASLEFHPQGQKVHQDDRPDLESVRLIPRTEDPVLLPPASLPRRREQKHLATTAMPWANRRSFP